MSVHLGHLLAGLGGGAVVAALSLGLVLSYRSSGVINFAHAAMGLYSASAFFELRRSGDLVLPVLGLPARVPLVDRPTVVTAALVVAVVTAALGAVTYALLIRPLRAAPPLQKVAVTLGLFLYLQEMVRLRFPPSSSGGPARRPILPTDPVQLLGTSVTRNRLVLAVLVVVVAVLLGALYRYTRFGLASRAASENEEGALLVGLSPFRYALVSWALGAVLAGAAVVLVEPIAGLGPTTSLLVVPALAAALPGRLRSFPIAVVGGLTIGMVQSLVLGHAVGPGGSWIPTWLPTTGLQEAVPTLVIVGVLMWRGGQVVGRGEAAGGGVVAAPVPRNLPVWAAVSTLAGAAALLSASAPYRQALIVSMIFALLCLSIVVLTGYSGQISFAQLAIAGVGGFAVLRLAGAGVPFVFAAVLATLLAAVVGTLLAYPATRLRGTSFAVATLAMAVMLERLVLQSSAVSGGAVGRDVPRPSLLGLDLGISAPGADNFRPAFGLTVLVVLVLSCVVVARLRRSSTGLHWLAVASNERAAAAAGVDVAWAKLTAFAVASALAGLAGVFMAFSVVTVSSQSFMVIGSIVALALTALAGVSRIAGALLAGALAQSGVVTTAISRLGGDQAGEYAFALNGVALMATVVLAPAGLVAVWAAGFRRLRTASGPPPEPRTATSRVAVGAGSAEGGS